MITGWPGSVRSRERAVALAGVALVHVGVLLFLLLARSGPPPQPSAEHLPHLIIVELPPAPPPVRSAAAQRPRAAAPSAAKALPKPIMAMPANISPAVPLAAPPIASEGIAAKAGDAQAGSGTGAGANGSSLASGGGIVSHAEWLSGAITDSDYPKEAKRAGLQGAIAVRFTVRTDGRVEDCRIEQSSRSDALDRLTCALVEQRMRYAPARDAAGRPIQEAAGRYFRFVLGRRRF